MEHLGYRPNYAARALKSGHFNNVGVLLSHMSAYGNSRILEGITTAAANSGYSITIRPLDNLQDQSLAGALKLVEGLPLDGAIVIMERDFTDFNQFKPSDNLPVVLICEEPANHCPTIDSDSYGCATAAVDFFLSKGHKTVYHIAGPTVSRAAQSRIRGWRDALAQVGIPHTTPCITATGKQIAATKPDWPWLTKRIAPQFSQATIKWHTVPCLA